MIDELYDTNLRPIFPHEILYHNLRTSPGVLVSKKIIIREKKFNKFHILIRVISFFPYQNKQSLKVKTYRKNLIFFFKKYENNKMVVLKMKIIFPPLVAPCNNKMLPFYWLFYLRKAFKISPYSGGTNAGNNPHL